ncbi:MAG TPA: AIR synthase related protein, partial [Actinomycetota bacterium]
MAASALLRQVVEQARRHPGLRGKAPIALVAEALGPTDWLSGPGDDGAVIADRDGRGSLVVGGEAMLPRFVEADPFAAGVSAVLTNVNDLCAMGAWPLAIVDTVVGPEALARRVLEGMRHGSELYRVPVVGGHLTVRDGPAAVSAFGLGRAAAVLSVRAAAPGQTLLAACCLEGTMRPDFPFFSSLPNRGGLLADDVRLLPRLAESG